MGECIDSHTVSAEKKQNQTYLDPRAKTCNTGIATPLPLLCYFSELAKCFKYSMEKLDTDSSRFLFSSKPIGKTCILYIFASLGNEQWKDMAIFSSSEHMDSFIHTCGPTKVVKCMHTSVCCQSPWEISLPSNFLLL